MSSWTHGSTAPHSGLWVFPQRFTLDTSIMQRLVYKVVGTPEEPRNLPRLLDVMAGAVEAGSGAGRTARPLGRVPTGLPVRVPAGVRSRGPVGRLEVAPKAVPARGLLAGRRNDMHE